MRPRRIVLHPNFDHGLRALDRVAQAATFRAINHFRERTAENAIRVEFKRGLDTFAFRATPSIRVFYLSRRDDKGQYCLIYHVGRHDDYRIAQRRKPA